MKKCPDCSGTGNNYLANGYVSGGNQCQEPYRKCVTCNGTGEVTNEK